MKYKNLCIKKIQRPKEHSMIIEYFMYIYIYMIIEFNKINDEK